MKIDIAYKIQEITCTCPARLISMIQMVVIAIVKIYLHQKMPQESFHIISASV